MTTSSPVTVTESNIDELIRLDAAPSGAAVLDVVVDAWRIGSSAIRWGLTLEDDTQLRSQYRNDLTDWPKGGRDALYLTERAARAWGSSAGGHIVRCAGLVKDPATESEHWRDVRVVG